MNERKIVGLIFSKDRAMQLQATIESFYYHSSDDIDMHVLYKTTSEVHKKQYSILKRKFAFITFHEEYDFKAQVEDIISGSEYILFVVDDDIFIRDFSLNNAIAALSSSEDGIGFSLLVGRNAIYCYSKNANQSLPSFEQLGNGILKYNWIYAEYDFAYPLGVSGSIYETSDILPVIRQIPFSNPNTLEGSLACTKDNIYGPNGRSGHLCYERSCGFMNPANLVQDVCENRVGRHKGYSVQKLADMFDNGFAIDTEHYSGFVPNSIIQEEEIQFTYHGESNVKFYNMTPNCQIPGLDLIYQRYFGWRCDGCFVEVGAYDGEHVSNTSGLADIGWRGYYIEPVPLYCRSCAERHRKNKNITVSQFAIGAQTGTVVVNVGGPLSTISDEMKRIYESLEWSKPWFNQKDCASKVTAKQITLADYLVRHEVRPGFELLIVDVEGTEWEVFRYFDIEKWHPKMVIVELQNQYYEASSLLSEDCKKVTRYFNDHNYKAIYDDSLNTIFVRNG